MGPGKKIVRSPGCRKPEYITFMRKALSQARKAYSKGEVPIGAVIVCDGRIVSQGYNVRESSGDPLSHAEIIAIGKACKKMGGFRLNRSEIFITVEPCLLCLGAILQARIKKLIYGCENRKEGALVLLSNIEEKLGMNYKLEVVGGILEEESKSLLSSFFSELRK